MNRLLPSFGWLLMAFGFGLLLASCATWTPERQPMPQPPGESPEPPVAVDPPPEPEPLDPADERLFGRLRARIDARVEQRMVAAMNDAAEDKTKGIGAALTLAVGRLVEKVAKVILVGLVVIAVKALLWQHAGLILGIFLAATLLVAVPSGWLSGRHAARPKEP